MWYWLSLSASCSFQPEHDKNNSDWLTALCFNYCLFSYGCPHNDDMCKHRTWINLHIQEGAGHLLEAMDRGPWEKPNHWVHYTDTVMTFGNLTRSKLSAFRNSRPKPLWKHSTVSQRVSDCPEYRQRMTLSPGFTLMRSGKALTSAGLLCVCGCLKQNQLQNCHTPSASVEFSGDLRTFTDRETIKIDNEDSSSYTKQGNEINSGHFCVKFGCWLSSTRTLAA